MSRSGSAGLGLLLVLGLATAGRAMDPPVPHTAPAGTEGLRRRWERLDEELRLLDGGLLPPEGSGPAEAPAAPPTRPLPPPPPLALPSAAALSRPGELELSLEQAVLTALAQSPTLAVRRQEVAAALATLQGRLGSYWPRLAAVGGLGYAQTNSRFVAPQGNSGLGFGANFVPDGLRAADGSRVDGPFAVPSGGSARLTQGVQSLGGGVELELALVDFARQPAIQAARAELRRARHAYATTLRNLQLEVSETYYGLQRADQLVRLRQAELRNDAVVLEEVLALQRAGLVPRLDRLRREAIEAGAEERLIQARADQAIGRRRLAALLNLAPAQIPSASDPIALQQRWPLDLEASLLAAYRDNPELEAVLATREALANRKDALAATLLPSLSLFALAGVENTLTNQWNASGDCCGVTVIPSLRSRGTDWAVGLTLRWLLFDGGRTAAEVRALAAREIGASQTFAERRNAIRLRLEQAFFEHEASLAKLASSRRAVAASREAFRDARLRYGAGLADETTLSLTQERLIASLVTRLEATVAVNVTYARLLRELLPVSGDPASPRPATLQLPP